MFAVFFVWSFVDTKAVGRAARRAPAKAEQLLYLCLGYGVYLACKAWDAVRKHPAKKKAQPEPYEHMLGI